VHVALSASPESDLLIQWLIAVLGSLGRLHPTEASMRTGNGAQITSPPVAQEVPTTRSAWDRAAYHKKCLHPFMRAWQATLAGEAVHVPAYDLLRTPAMR